MSLECQRLATIDDRIERVVVIDLGALFAHASKAGVPILRAAELIQEACSRGGRRAIWVLAPAADDEAPYHPPVSATVLGDLGAASHTVVTSSEPIGNLVYETLLKTPSARVSIVSAGVEERPHDLWILSGPVSSILDVGTGRLWRTDDLEGGEPWARTRAQAIIERSTKKKTHPEYLDATWRGVPSRDFSQLPKWMAQGLASRRDVVDRREAKLLGIRQGDAEARAALSSFVTSTPTPTTTTAYVCARVKRKGHTCELDELHALVGGVWVKATDPVELEETLVALLPHERWFGPQIIDLLAWMAQQGLPLPKRAVDPAWSAFAVHPERPVDLARVSPNVLALSPSVRRWLADHERRSPLPTSLSRVAPLLPNLDRGLGQLVAREGLQSLVEDDLGRTLPVIAAIEARGVAMGPPVGFPSWDAFGNDVVARFQAATSAAHTLLGPVDVVANEALTARAIEKVVGTLLPAERKGVRIAHQLQRYFEVFSPALDEARRGREIGHFILAEPMSDWIADAVHATTTPLTSGRLGMHSPALQALPKRTPEGNVLRSAFRARPGHRLVSADYNAFEVRVAAELSNDPLLVAASTQPDAWAYLTQAIVPARLQGPGARTLVKLGMLAYFYGQSRDYFWKELTTISHADADALFDAFVAKLSAFDRFRRGVHDSIDAKGFVKTPGGWRRWLEDGSSAARLRAGFSTLIQGFAADIFRRVLRELHVKLEPYRGHIVHHVHDEVVVEVLIEFVDAAKKLLVEVMTTAAYATPALMQAVPLVVKDPKEGDTWADLI